MVFQKDKVLNWRNYFLKSFGTEYIYMTYRIAFDNLYRGRPFKDYTLSMVQDEIKNKSGIWCPPKRKCSKQRCNLKGNPLLYLSSHRSSIPLELECKTDDLIAIINYKQTNYFQPLAIVGWDDLMKIPKGISELIKNHFNDKSQKVIEIDKKLSRIFKTPRRDLEKFDIYDICIGLTQLFFKSGSIGLIYPSVASGYKSFNIVLKPNHVKSLLKPINISIYKVMDLITSESVGLQRLSIGEIFANGEIKWKNEIKRNIFKFEK